MVVVEAGGGGHGFLPTIVGFAMRGGQEKNTPNNRGGLPKIAREKI